VNQKIEHAPMRVPHVATIAEFRDVFPSVLGRNVNVRALDRALEQRPMAFQRVHMMNALHVFFRGVIDRAVRVVTA
jgi:hypothetical protein